MRQEVDIHLDDEGDVEMKISSRYGGTPSAYLYPGHAMLTYVEVGEGEETSEYEITVRRIR